MWPFSNTGSWLNSSLSHSSRSTSITLVYDLKVELVPRIGDFRRFEVCFDRESLGGHDTLSDKIAAQIKASALFIAVRLDRRVAPFGIGASRMRRRPIIDPPGLRG
jgi:hypothetical protein